MSLFTALLLGGMLSLPPQGTEPPPTKLALLIGISDYPEIEEYEEFPPLSGCLNDVELMRQVLVERFGFEDQGADIQILLNQEATHQNVVLAIYQLITKAGAGTEVLIYFSGHGSRLPDSSGKAAVEVDSMDSTFVLYDSRDPKLDAPFDMTDDELFSLVQELCAKTTRVTLITDCCHSGGVVRGSAGMVERRAPAGKAEFNPENLEPFWPKEIPLLEDGDIRRQRDLPYVHIAACSADEVAREIKFEENNSSHGVLTYFLVDALRNLEPGTTFEKLAAHLRVQVLSRVWDQQVQLEGSADRIVFSGDFAEPLPGFPGTAEAESLMIEIDAGRLHLLSKDTVFDIQDLSGNNLGSAAIWELDAFSCIAKWQDAASEPSLTMPVRALVQGNWTAKPMRIYVEEGEVGDGISASLSKEIGAKFEVIRDPSLPSECVLKRSGEDPDGPWSLISSADGELLWSPISTRFEAGAKPVNASLYDADFSAIATVLTREHLYQSLMELGNSRGGIGLDLSIQPAGDETLKNLRSINPDRQFSAATSLDQPSGLANEVSSFSQLLDRQEGDLADVAELKVIMDPRTRQIGGYLAILCLSSDRTIATIYPTNSAKENFLEPGADFSLPIEVYFNAGADPELGVHDRYFAIVTASWVDFSVFSRSVPVQQAADKARGASLRGTGGPDHQMPSVLQQALQGKVTRGGPIKRSDDWSFGVTSLDIHIHLPKN